MKGSIGKDRKERDKKRKEEGMGGKTRPPN